MLLLGVHNVQDAPEPLCHLLQQTGLQAMILDSWHRTGIAGYKLRPEMHHARLPNIK